MSYLFHACILFHIFLLNIFGFISCQEEICGQAAYPRPPDLSGEISPLTGDWPWMIAFRRWNDSSYACTGSLISSRHVLTVAHCFDDSPLSLFYVVLGNVNRARSNVARVLRLATSGGYTKGRYYNDLAVVTLTREAFFSDFNPVCLLPDNKDLNGKNATVVGWGATTPGGGPSVTLVEQRNQEVIPNKLCTGMFRELPFFQTQFTRGLSSSMLCAGLLKTKGKCAALSGSALMIQEEEKWYLIGIGAFGHDCGSGYPSGYIRVSKFLDWIPRNLN